MQTVSPRTNDVFGVVQSEAKVAIDSPAACGISKGESHAVAALEGVLPRLIPAVASLLFVPTAFASTTVLLRAVEPESVR
jgi:hypothetical protein